MKLHIARTYRKDCPCEVHKTIGILDGPWETDTMLKEIISKSYRPNDKIVTGDDPKKLVADVIAIVKKYKLD